MAQVASRLCGSAAPLHHNQNQSNIRSNIRVNPWFCRWYFDLTHDVGNQFEPSQGSPTRHIARYSVPDLIQADSRLWISIESEDGQTAQGSVALPRAEAGHHDGDGHRH